MEIIFYCQYVWGMGHLVRSLEFARALADHEVTLVAGGQAVPLNIPAHIDFVRLPALYMDELFTKLIAGDPQKSVAEIQRERKEILYSLFEKKRPDIFIVELYPFGRSIFRFELDPVLRDIRSGSLGSVRTVCSLRDILVEKKDPAAYEERVIQQLNRHFDALLVHSDENLLRLDETFSRVGDLRLPLIYTGFITQRAAPGAGGRLRRELRLSDQQKLIVASVGGGRSGYKLLTSVLDAFEPIDDHFNLRLEVFTGPFMESEEFDRLAARAASGIRIQRFTRRFVDYLAAADLSVSLAGYNTCMNLLATGVPALVYPYARQREQPLRVDRIKDLLPMRVLNDEDVQPQSLGRHMIEMLDQKKIAKLPGIDLNGADHAAEFLERWCRSDKG
jgi:predicted glycosyltransferase